jgi:glycosyltransferase involved in cell wall biosynthesis
MSESAAPKNPSAFKRLRFLLIPVKSTREYFLWEGVAAYRSKGLAGLLRFLVKLFLIFVRKTVEFILPPIGPFAIQYNTEDNSQVTVYTDRDLLLDYPHRTTLSGSPRQRISVSLITTTFNEKDSVSDWMESLFHQTRLPDEMIVVDGGSQDGTLELLREFAKQSPFPIIVLSEPGANIARGRNIAIAQARHPFIASADFGCRLHPDWLEKLVLPFECDPGTQVVAGWYRVIKSGRARLVLLGPALEEVNPQDFLPSSRSLAFSKAAWEKAGGYPEWLTLTGEDTVFALELKRCCSKWAFAPEAVVDWQAPSSARAYWRKLFTWSIGDGESGFNARLYWHSLLRVALIACLTLILTAAVITTVFIGQISAWLAIPILLLGELMILFLGFSGNLRSFQDIFLEIGAEIARVAGFIEGAKHRQAVNVQRYSLVQGVCFILSGVPIDDNGGGARCTQISLELLRQGYSVVFINKYPKYESVNLKLNLNHPNLFTYQVSDFNWAKFKKQYAALLNGRPLAAIIEFPLNDFLPLISSLRQSGGVVLYDLLDAWDTSLGSQWYSLETEKQIIASSQALAATEASLAARLEQMSGRSVCLLPNAVNAHLFDPQQIFARPDDFPPATWSMIYIGALWGEWFDWDLLLDCARRYPEAAVVIVGDYHGQCANPPTNLYFLGLKPQRALPAYLALADVAIIPWKVSPITQATSPLKVYEYIAMRKPVVVPDLRPLQCLPGVFSTPDKEAFITMVGQARGVVLPEQEITHFVSMNNWQARVSIVLEQIRLYGAQKQ